MKYILLCTDDNKTIHNIDYLHGEIMALASKERERNRTYCIYDVEFVPIDLPYAIGELLQPEICLQKENVKARLRWHGTDAIRFILSFMSVNNHRAVEYVHQLLSALLDSHRSSPVLHLKQPTWEEACTCDDLFESFPFVDILCFSLVNEFKSIVNLLAPYACDASWIACILRVGQDAVLNRLDKMGFALLADELAMKCVFHCANEDKMEITNSAYKCL